MSPRKKVVLYNPKAVFHDMPLALMAIGSALDTERFEVVIVDTRIEEKGHEKLLREAENAICVGMTVLTGAPIRDALEAGRKLKARFPEIPLIWGGWHASLFPKETLIDEATIDITVQGQGEETFRELVDELILSITKNGRGNTASLNRTALEGINGITFRKEGLPFQTPARVLRDMNELPGVNYDLIDVEPYFKAKGRRQLDYISSTGCFFRCTFCADPFVFKRNWTAISPERMGKELAHWVEKFSVTDVNFQDETFFTYRDRSMAIAEAFLNRMPGVSWAATMRADQCHRMKEEDFSLLARSGLRRLLIGVESGSQEMMDWLKKDIRIEYVWEAAERCGRYGIHVIFPFIVGFPGESDASVLASLSMAAQLRQIHPGFTTPVFYFKPYPGAGITTDLSAGGYQLPQSLEAWADFDYIGSSGPWVTEAKYRMVENFKFYNRLAGGNRKGLAMPFQKLAQWRLSKKMFGFPAEKKLVEWLMPGPELS